MSNWKSIRTAPKDGSMILVCGGKYESDLESNPRSLTAPMIVYWSDDYSEEGAWEAKHTCYYSVRAKNPTHWQPLPALPKEVENE